MIRCCAHGPASYQRSKSVTRWTWTLGNCFCTNRWPTTVRMNVHMINRYCHSIIVLAMFVQWGRLASHYPSIGMLPTTAILNAYFMQRCVWFVPITASCAFSRKTFWSNFCIVLLVLNAIWLILIMILHPNFTINVVMYFRQLEEKRKEEEFRHEITKKMLSLSDLDAKIRSIEQEHNVSDRWIVSYAYLFSSYYILILKMNTYGYEFLHLYSDTFCL